MEGQLFYGSICVSDLLDKLKERHSAFTKGTNGKIYGTVNVWLNKDVDKYGNIMSIQINPSKEMKDKEERFYIGNLKKSEGSRPVSENDVSGVDDNFSDIPVRETKKEGASDISTPF